MIFSNQFEPAYLNLVKPDFDVFRFLNRFMYRNPKKHDVEHGHSLMQVDLPSASRSQLDFEVVIVGLTLRRRIKEIVNIGHHLSTTAYFALLKKTFKEKKHLAYPTSYEWAFCSF